MRTVCPGGGSCRRFGVLLLWSLLLSIFPLTAAGAGAATDPPPEEGAILQLPPLLVTEPALAELTGSSRLAQEVLRHLPGGTANASDFAPLLPGVQASDDAALSTRGGEILPALISISGGRADQNNFVVDGIGSSSLLDPLANNPEDPQNIPGHPQGLLPNLRLVEELAVLDHNIPARYGNFTGGVLEIHTRKPKAAVAAGANLRSTRSGWTWFQVPAEEEAAFRSSSSHKQQPRFAKYDGGVELDLPAGPAGGLLTAYQRTWSDISLSYLGGRKSQRRLLENYLAKWARERGGESLELTAISTPYRGDYFLKDTRNGDYAVRSRNLKVEAEQAWTGAAGRLELVAAYAGSTLSRHAPQDYRLWLKTPSRNWGGGSYSAEGGFGSLERSQETFQLQLHLTGARFAAGGLRQTVAGGVQVGWTSARAQRRAATRSYSGATALAATTSCNGDPACIDGEQYFKTIKIYDPYAVETDRAELGAYLEDNLALGRLELRPGLRLDYDTLSQNQNLAPRFAAGFDLFGTRLLPGANRYYAGATFTDILREGEAQPRTLTRTALSGAWTERLATTSTRSSDLKTPYADEVSAGIEQPVPGGEVAVTYVHRKGKDEIARQLDQVKVGATTYNIYRFNNHGRSRYESYRLTWAGVLLGSELRMNVGNEKAQVSVEKYDDFLDGKALDRPVYYNGRLLQRDELPRTDYNRNWLGNLVLVRKLPLGFEFSNVTRYRGAYHALRVIKTNQTIDGQVVDVYGEVKSPAAWTFDWKLAWRQALGRGEVLLGLELLNVFNRSNRVGGEVGEYETGRQLWAGVEGRF